MKKIFYSNIFWIGMSELDLKGLSDKIDSTIFFNFFDESYRGTLYYVDEANKRLTIQNVYDLSTNEPYLGFMEIYPNDINSEKFSINSIINSKSVRKNLTREEKDKLDEELLNTSNISILKNSFSQVVPVHKQISDISLSSITTSLVHEEWHEDNSSKHVSSPNLSTEAFPFGIISDFDSAISILDFQLKQSDKIGLRAFTCHQKKLSLVCLKCDDFIWCFDYLSIKKQSTDNAKLFINKIESILNDNKISKIFHDYSSLENLFSTRIRNYVDLDTCYKQLYHDQFGQSIYSNSSMRRLIELYTDDFINERHYENLDWSKRPFNMHQKNVFTKETKYLIDLYNKSLELKKAIKNLNLLVNVFEEPKKIEETKKENCSSHRAKISVVPTPKLDELVANASKWTSSEKLKNDSKEKYSQKSKYPNYIFRPAGCPLGNPHTKKSMYIN
ncbi:hypothetical protein BpHYR1_020464 [Brachionus plicatilis]|uniref:3'-5' exonuclease domain-containing protein n=1 Tax=Brachionus plicatilis TaxID=10195 RepID=A0A3M7Q1T4_BRAPC|nr:hypothetical protein BpHYR1_020464 [Brachionus plicatilis]